MWTTPIWSEYVYAFLSMYGQRRSRRENTRAHRYVQPGNHRVENRRKGGENPKKNEHTNER